MRRISGAASRSVLEVASSRVSAVLHRQQPLGALPLGDLALEDRLVTLDRRGAARAALEVLTALLYRQDQQQILDRQPADVTDPGHDRADRDGRTAPPDQKKLPSIWSARTIPVDSSSSRVSR